MPRSRRGPTWRRSRRPLRPPTVGCAGSPACSRSPTTTELVSRVESRLDELEAFADEVDHQIESGIVGADDIEGASATLVDLRDASWAIRHDRLRTAREVALLAGRDASVGAMAGYLAVQRALSAIDRLEVRGRDSAGLHLFVWNHGLDDRDPAVAAIGGRAGADPLFQSSPCASIDGCLSFVYKAAAEIGELGDNTTVLRAAVARDAVLRLALGATDARSPSSVTPGGRASASSPSPTPIRSTARRSSAGGEAGPTSVAALNGDVDNHADLRVEHGLRIPGQITTDAKVIPALVARTPPAGNRSSRRSDERSRRSTVGRHRGGSADAPDTLLLALRGSGQGLYIGLADDCYIVASEPYGVVEETTTTSASTARPREPGRGKRGEIVVLDGAAAETSTVSAGSATTARRCRSTATRSCTPRSPPATSTGVTPRTSSEGDPRGARELPQDAARQDRRARRRPARRRRRPSVPPRIAARLAAGAIARSGHRAGHGGGRRPEHGLDPRRARATALSTSTPMTATELSGFSMRARHERHPRVAVSQSGTTTDTNRTVDLCVVEAPPCSASSTVARATWSTRPTASCTRRTDVTSR